jgi:hypothetical protein
MSSITATAVPASGYVRVEVDWSDISGPPRKAWVYRVVGGVTTTLRDADPVLLSGGRAVIYDTESLLDTSMTYRSTVALNQNGDFEDEDISDWAVTAFTGTVGTVARSLDYYVRGEGLASLKLTPSGAATSRAVGDFVAATAGVSYSFSGRLMVPSFWGGGIGIQVHWYNGTSFLSASGAANDFWPSVGEFGTYSFSATAPATTTAMRIVAAIVGSAPKTLPLYADEMYITRSGVTTINSSSITLASNGVGWWKDPLHPATAVPLLMSLTPSCTPVGTVYGGVSSTFTRAADSSLSDVNGSDLPVSTWSTRKGPQSSMRVGTASIADRDAVLALHAPGAPLLLQIPTSYNQADQYQQHGDLQEGFLGPDQRKPWRAIQSGYAQVDAPVGPAEGVLGVRYMDINKWATYYAAEAFGGGSYDTFSRTAVDTWSPNDNGDAYTLIGTATDYDINGSIGTMSIPAVSTTREARLVGLSLATVRARVIFGLTTTLTGTTTLAQTIRLRHVDSNNLVEARLIRNISGTVTLTLNQIVGGVNTGTSGAITLTGVTVQQDIQLQVDANGTSLTAWAWTPNTTRPIAPTASLTVSHTVAGIATFASNTGSGVTSLPVVATVDNLQVTNLAGSTAQNTWWDLLQGEGHV